MAIQLNLPSSPLGVGFVGAYARLSNVVVSRTRASGADKYQVCLDVIVYAASPADEDVREVESRRHYTTMSQLNAAGNGNVYDKAYAWLMAQPEYVGGVEV